jgi:hypothetical protein
MENNTEFKIARIRHFYDFESINVLKHTQEITFYFNGKTTHQLHFYSNDFKEFLNILDNNNEMLQFHGELAEYFDIGYSSEHENVTNFQNNNKEGFKIIIDFPTERPLKNNEFRTIFLIDKVDIPIEMAGHPIAIDVPFDEASHTYLYFNKLPQYKTKINDIFYSREDIDSVTGIPKSYFKLEESEEKEFLDHFETTSFYCIYSTVPITNCNILIGIKYNLRKFDASWFYSGILVGSLAIIFNSYLAINRLNSSLVQITSLSTIAITYLVVIKGWVFMKDLDDVILIFNPIDLPFKIRFSDVYLLLILVIFVELVLSLYFGITTQKTVEIIKIFNQHIFKF